MQQDATRFKMITTGKEVSPPFPPLAHRSSPQVSVQIVAAQAEDEQRNKNEFSSLGAA